MNVKGLGYDADKFPSSFPLGYEREGRHSSELRGDGIPRPDVSTSNPIILATV